MEFHPVGTRVVCEGRPAIIKEVDTSDETLPYCVEYDDTGYRAWVGPFEETDKIVFAIRESDLEGVEINTSFTDGRVKANGWIVFPSETPEDLRKRIAFNREKIIAYEAIARFKEGRGPAPTERQSLVAYTIYDKSFTELDDGSKAVVNRVVDSFFGKDN